MDISIYKTSVGFGFRIGKFDSCKHFFLSHPVRSNYKYAWEAERDARFILKKCPSHLIVSHETDAQEDEISPPPAESMIKNHYLKTYDHIVDKASGVKDAEDEERKKVYEEIKIIVGGLLKIQNGITMEDAKKDIDSIIGKFSRLVKENFNDFLAKDRKEQEGNLQQPAPPLPPQAPQEGQSGMEEAQMSLPPMTASSIHKKIEAINNRDEVSLTKDEIKELIEHYAISACRVLQSCFPDSVYVLYPEKSKLDIVSSGGQEKYIRISVGNNFMVDGIYPYPLLGKLSDKKFYQKYWKPIVEEIGHYNDSSHNAIIVCSKTVLPDIPLQSRSFDVGAFDVMSKKPCKISLSFLDDNLWRFSRSTTKSIITSEIKPSRYKEQDYVGKDGPAIVECKDPTLKSIYLKSGVVVQVIPFDTHVEVDVDFGRHVVRLTEEQIEIKNEV